MKKIITTALVVIILLIPVSSFACTTLNNKSQLSYKYAKNSALIKNSYSYNWFWYIPSYYPWGFDFSDLTNEEKNKIQNAWKKMMEANRDMIEVLVSNEIISEQRGNEYIDMINELIEFVEKNGLENIDKFKLKTKSGAKKKNNTNNKKAANLSI